MNFCFTGYQLLALCSGVFILGMVCGFAALLQMKIVEWKRKSGQEPR